MKIAVIGSGNVGRALASRWRAAGHDVVFGSRDPGGGGEATRIERLTVSEAVAGSEVVVLAVPWSGLEDSIAEAGDLDGKLVIDCTNPLSPDLSGLLELDRSAGEQVAAMAVGGSVFKAFNTTGSNIMQDPVIEGRRCLMPFCGDDESHRERVRGLIEDVGFEAVYVGGLSKAGLLESLAMLWITLAYEQQMGREFALGILRRHPTR